MLYSNCYLTHIKFILEIVPLLAVSLNSVFEIIQPSSLSFYLPFFLWLYFLRFFTTRRSFCVSHKNDTEVCL
jgi:hypothetical protein